MSTKKFFKPTLISKPNPKPTSSEFKSAAEAMVDLNPIREPPKRKDPEPSGEETTVIRSSGRRIILSNAPASEAKSSSDNESDEEKPKKFRFCASTAFLTYPQSGDVTKEDLLEFLKSKGAVQWIIAREKHLTGEYHLHAFVKFNKEIDTRNVRYFDCMDLHPNIKNGEIKKKWQKAVEYCMKAGDYITEGIELFDSSENFCRRKNDFDAWKRYVTAKTDQPLAFPINLPDGKSQITRPVHSNRKRHWWITAPPNWGKTYWANFTFAGVQLFCPISNSDTPFDHYNNQQLILFDDFLWKQEHKSMIQDVSNVWNISRHVWGRTRFYPKEWERGQIRIIVVLANDIPFGWDQEGWFTTRFNVLDVSDLSPFDPLDDYIPATQPFEP